MIKIVSAYSHASGSSSALVNLCSQFNSRGYPCVFYGPDYWHRDKCESGALTEFVPEAGDIIILNDIPLLSVDELSDVNALAGLGRKNSLSRTLRGLASRFLPGGMHYDYKLFLTCLGDEGLPRASVNLALFQKIHFAGDSLKSHCPAKYPAFVAPSFVSSLGTVEHKPHKVAGIVGSIKRQNDIEEAIRSALSDGMETVCLYGYMKDPVYYHNKIIPLTLKFRGRIKYAGFIDNKQRMYDAVSDIYSSVSKPWSMVGRECALTNTACHVPGIEGAGNRLTNDQIFEIWKNELAL